jgi:signal transduction histidine kinase
MSVLSPSGPVRPRSGRRSIRFSFTLLVAAPVACLVLLWGLAVAAALRNASGRFRLLSHRGMGEVGLLAGGGLVVVLIAAILVGLFARRVAKDVQNLEATARQLAEEQLPRLLERLRQGDLTVAADSGLTRPAAKTGEVAKAGAAIASLQQTAVAAAAREASLREAVGKVFVSLARRNQSLLQRQLRLIDSLEAKAASPAALADLFPLDHLTTRMRRHAEGLIILSGAAPGRSWSEPVPVIDVIRGAIAEVEDYKRVRVATKAEDAVTGSAVADMIHLLAELIENATLFSPSGTHVEVRAGRVANGFAVEVDDRGLGIPTDQLTDINEQLASPPGFDLANADRLGLFVVARLAARHSVRVSLRPSPYGGTTAIVLMPGNLVVAPDPDTDAAPAARGAASPPGLPRGAREALSLTGPGLGAPTPGPAIVSGRGASAGPAVGPVTGGIGSGFGTPGPGLGATPAWGAGQPPDPAGPGTGGFDTGRLDLGGAGLGAGGAGAAAAGVNGWGAGKPGARQPATDRPGTDIPGAERLDATGPIPASPDPAAGYPTPGGPPRGGSVGPAGPTAGNAPSAGSPSAGAPSAGGPSASAPAGGTYRGLPRRVRQANLSPHLRTEPAVRPGASPAASQAGDRTPEDTRSLVASLQSGWQRGRQPDEPPDTQPADGTQRPGQPGTGTPRSEEA